MFDRRSPPVLLPFRNCFKIQKYGSKEYCLGNKLILMRKYGFLKSILMEKRIIWFRLIFPLGQYVSIIIIVVNTVQ